MRIVHNMVRYLKICCFFFLLNTFKYMDFPLCGTLFKIKNKTIEKNKRKSQFILFTITLNIVFECSDLSKFSVDKLNYRISLFSELFTY